jgi:CRISPR/Cas system CSM-associated protein Csm3 (group 7 of RAMP superfamily)
MSAIQPLAQLPAREAVGNQLLFALSLKITVAEGSFLHIGGTPSPLTEKKQPVFTVDGQPVIPASSFKGAFRHQVELLMIQKKDRLAQDLGLLGQNADLLEPSIPAPKPSRAEKELKDYRREGNCELRVDEEGKITVNPSPNAGLCPACYFFGATGLEGFLRITNFFPQSGEWRIDQTRIRIDRKTQTAASGAIVTGEQVKPGSVFRGVIYLFQERHGASLGRCREIGGTKVDLWLLSWSEPDDTKRQLYLINNILIPALDNLKVLGGQKSLGAGRVEITLDPRAATASRL